MNGDYGGSVLATLVGVGIGWLLVTLVTIVEFVAEYFVGS